MAKAQGSGKGGGAGKGKGGGEGKGRKPAPLFEKHETGIKARFRGWMRNAERWEVISLGMAPLAVLFVMNQHALGIPAAFTGYSFVLLVYYAGYIFLVLLIWDRRLDTEKIRIGRGLRRKKLSDISAREEQRKSVSVNRADAQARSEAALRRGQMKASGLWEGEQAGDAGPKGKSGADDTPAA